MVFAALCLASLILVVAAEISGWQWLKAIERVGQSTGRLIITVTAITFIIVEGGPMIAAWLRRTEIKQAREEGMEAGRKEGMEAGRKEGMEAGREEGADRMHREWQIWRMAMETWQLRKENAEREGREFTEPPPDEPRPPTRQ